MRSDALLRPTDAVLRGDTADVYFHRTKEILTAANEDPMVTMEVFAGRDGVLCGMREVRALLAQVCSPQRSSRASRMASYRTQGGRAAYQATAIRYFVSTRRRTSAISPPGRVGRRRRGRR